MSTPHKPTAGQLRAADELRTLSYGAHAIDLRSVPVALRPAVTKLEHDAATLAAAMTSYTGDDPEMYGLGDYGTGPYGA